MSEASSETLTSGEEIAIQCVGILNAFLLLSTLVFAIYNTITYLIPLKITKSLILIFYLLTYCLMIFRLIDTSETIMEPEQNKFDYEIGNTSIGVIFRSASECVLVGLGFLIVVTMYQLACSVKLVRSKITVE